jgi:hypothetical protein
MNSSRSLFCREPIPGNHAPRRWVNSLFRACRLTRFGQIARYVGIGHLGVKNPIERDSDGRAAGILSVWVIIVEPIAHRFNLGMAPSHQILYPGLRANGGPSPTRRVFVV